MLHGPAILVPRRIAEKLAAAAVQVIQAGLLLGDFKAKATPQPRAQPAHPRG